MHGVGIDVSLGHTQESACLLVMQADEEELPNYQSSAQLEAEDDGGVKVRKRKEEEDGA